MASLLKVSGLNISFDGDPAITNLNFEIEEGDSLAIIGPNGAGKTILLRALLGMLPYKGSIAWTGRASIGYVPQKIDADRHLPVNFKNLFGAKASTLHLPKKDLDEIIKTVGIDQKILETPVGHLSGGQFQRALIAFALLGKPKILLFDEPTASIDISGEEQIYELIHDLQDQYGITVVVVSHDLSFVYRYATKVLCLGKSGGLCFGAPQDALTPDVLEKLYGPHKYYHHFHDR